MKKISSLGLIILIICSVFNAKAQTSPSTITVPGIGTVSESTLQSVGLSPEEVNAVLGQQPAAAPATNAIEQTQSTLESQQQAAQDANATPADNPPPAVIQQVVADNANPPQAAGAIFGQDFFRNGNITLFEKVPNAKVSDGYIIGPGDQISVSVYGDVSSYNQSFTVNDDGYIDVYGIGRIYVQGLTYGATKKLLRQRFDTYINVAKGNFDVSLTYSKSIKVNIVGEVNNPGSYNIASINTAFNALVAAGGPNDIGSIRNIQVKRDGKVIKTLDIYQFLMNPGTTDDTYLQNNDYIVVMPLGRVVSIQGEVNRPHKYELIPGENLNELIYYAGGLKSTAYKRNVTVKRYTGNENVVLDINFDDIMKSNTNYQVEDGDVVTFQKIPEIVENVVSIQGSVRFPGTYQLTEGLRISDVIEKAKGLTYEAYTDRAYLIRKDDKLNDVYIPFSLKDVIADPNSPFNFKLNKFDVIDVFTKDKFREIFNVQIQGAVKAPGTFPYYKNMTLKDILYYTGGLKVEAANSKIEISRIINIDQAIQEDIATRVIIETVSVGKNLEIPDAAESFMLQPYDIIYVRTTPEFELQKTVTLQGEVQYPGPYSILSKTETVADIIERAGGITQYAYVNGATITRSNTTNTLLFLDKALKDPKSKYNYVVHDGDVISVPKQGDLVSMKGAIQYPFVGDAGNVMAPFEKGRTARYYVKHYGKNFHENAERKSTYIVQPNGYVKRTHNILFIHFYPRVKVKGSEIVVPEKPADKETPEAPAPAPTPFDWNTFATTMSASILAFATIFVLITNGKR